MKRIKIFQSQINPQKALILFCLSIISSGRDFLLLSQSPAAVGIDGYYYVLQINTFLQSGRFYFSTRTPLVLYLLSCVSFLIGDNVPALKASALAMHFLLCLGIFSILLSTTKNFWLGLLGFGIAAFSNLHFYFISEFLSNLGALVFFTWSIFCIAQFAQTQRKRWIGYSIIMFIAAVLSHRSIIFLSLLALFSFFLARLFTNHKNSGTKFLFHGVLILLIFVPMFLKAQNFFDLPSWVLNEMSVLPQNPFRLINQAESLILLFVLLIFSVVWLMRGKERFDSSALLLLTILILTVLITLNPFLNYATGFQGIVGRLGSLSYIQAALALPLLIAQLLFVSRKLAVLTAFALSSLIIMSFLAPLPLGMRPEYLQTREELVRTLPSMKTELCANPFVVAQHGEQFVVTAVTGIRSQQAPVNNIENQCIYWLIRLPQNESKSRPSGDENKNDGHILVDASQIENYLASISAEQRKQIIALNYHIKNYFLY